MFSNRCVPARCFVRLVTAPAYPRAAFVRWCASGVVARSFPPRCVRGVTASIMTTLSCRTAPVSGVAARVWEVSTACVETTAIRRSLMCHPACGFRRRSAGCLRSGSTRTRSVFCGVVDPSFAASLYGARSTSSRVSGRSRSPALRPPRCGTGCRAVSGDDLHAGRARVHLGTCCVFCGVADTSLAASLYLARCSRSTRRVSAANTVVGVRPPGASNSGSAALLARPARQIVRQLALQDCLQVRQFSRHPGPRFRGRSARIGLQNRPWRHVGRYGPGSPGRKTSTIVEKYAIC